MNHSVPCSRCPGGRRFVRGVTRIRRFVVFHFCADCQLNHPEECERIMTEVAGPAPERRERPRTGVIVAVEDVAHATMRKAGL
jgi:hypothetical protein